MPASLTAYLWLKGGYPGLPGFSCPLRALTGIPCPSCFLTRATCASLRGDFSSAIKLHAFGPLLAVGLVIWSLAALRRRRLGLGGIQAWHLAATALALGAYWALRLVFSYGLGLEGFLAFPALIDLSAFATG